MIKKEIKEYRRKNKLILNFLAAKVIRKGLDVNIYIDDEKVLKMGTFTEKQAWDAATEPNKHNFNSSWSRLLPVFFKIVEARGKEHSVSKQLVDMLLTKNLENFYSIIVNYIESDNNNFTW